MKTPEEIKDALDTCGKRRICLSDCPYFGEEGCNAHLEKDALDLIQQLEAQVPKWISVEERLPERIVTGCLVYADGWTQVADWTHDKCGNDWWFYVDGEYDPEITHWMPLPEPPKEEEK